MAEKSVELKADNLVPLLVALKEPQRAVQMVVWKAARSAEHSAVLMAGHLAVQRVAVRAVR